MQIEKKAKGGRRSKLNLKDQLLVTLEYIREYRTYFHIGKSYCISEGTVYTTRESVCFIFSYQLF